MAKKGLDPSHAELSKQKLDKLETRIVEKGGRLGKTVNKIRANRARKRRMLDQL